MRLISLIKYLPLLFCLFQIGLEGEGLEPTIEALFGENGFFPDTISKAIYWTNDQVPPQVRKVLEKWVGPLKGNRMKREVYWEYVTLFSSLFWMNIFIFNFTHHCLHRSPRTFWDKFRTTLKSSKKASNLLKTTKMHLKSWHTSS